MATQIQLRRGNAADWSTANPVLAEGELSLELDTKKFKIGDGTTAWNSLPYSTGAPTTRVVSLADSSTVTLNSDTTDIGFQINTQAAGTLTVAAPAGTPTNGQKIMFRLKSTNIQTFSWNSAFDGSNDLPLPSTSTGGDKYDYMGFIYNSASSKWDLLAKNFGF